MKDEIIGGSDHLLAYRIPFEGRYLLESDLLDLFVSIVGSSSTVYNKYSLKAKDGYKKIVVNASEPEIFELYVDSDTTKRIAESGEEVKAQLNVITAIDTALVADGRKNLVTYVNLPVVVNPLTTVEA